MGSKEKRSKSGELRSKMVDAASATGRIGQKAAKRLHGKPLAFAKTPISSSIRVKQKGASSSLDSITANYSNG